MGNGTAGASGLASMTLNTPLPTKALAVSDLFAGETATFPIDFVGSADVAGTGGVFSEGCSLTGDVVATGLYGRFLDAR